jgi:hypothetical protein
MISGPFVTHIAKVNAPADVLWSKLVEKIRRPDLYVPGVKTVEVVQEFSPLRRASPHMRTNPRPRTHNQASFIVHQSVLVSASLVQGAVGGTVS